MMNKLQRLANQLTLLGIEQNNDALNTLAVDISNAIYEQNKLIVAYRKRKDLELMEFDDEDWEMVEAWGREWNNNEIEIEYLERELRDE